MSTLSIVVISVLAAIFGILLLASIGALVYIYILVRQQISTFVLTIKDTGVKLDQQFARIDTLIGTIHGDKIEKAAQVILEIVPKVAKEATRMEQACTAFRGALQVLTSEQEIAGSDIERARHSGLGPESYAHASPGERWTSRSRTAESDATAIDRESADNTTTTIDATDAALDIYDQSPDE